MRNVRTAFVVHDLAKLLTSCKHAYYTGAVGITDSDYDKLEYMLGMLCPNHPILQVVGIPPEDYKNPNIPRIMELMHINAEE